MHAYDLSKTLPSVAARALTDHVSKPGAYAQAIIAQGRDYTAAVCAAINTKTESDPETRRALYRVLHQAATRASAAFTLVSRKHSGLDVADAPAKGSASDAPASAHKAGSSAEKIESLTRRLAESEAERARLSALVTQLTAERDALRAKLKPAKPAARPAKPVIAATAVAA